MAFNTGSYNPYNRFQTPYRAYSPSATAFNTAGAPNLYATNGATPTTSAAGYSQPSAYGSYNAANRFQTPTYSYSSQTRYNNPAGGYGAQYPSMGTRYQVPRPYYEEPPQIIYMQQPAAPKKSAWDWKKFAMTAGAVATGLGVFFLMAKNVAKMELNQFIKNELPSTIEQMVQKGIDGGAKQIQGFLPQGTKLDSATLNQTAQQLFDTVGKAQNVVDVVDTFTKPFQWTANGCRAAYNWLFPGPKPTVQTMQQVAAQVTK